MKKNRTPYLLLLHQPSPDAALLAFNYCREAGIPVPAQYGNTAIEVLASPEEMEQLYASGLFSLKTKSVVKEEHRKKLEGPADAIISMWNARFSKEYRKRKKDYSKKGQPWQSKERKEPAPYSDIDPNEFSRRLAELLKKQKKQTGKKESKQLPGVNLKNLTPESFLIAEKYFRDKIKDERMAHDVSRLFFRLKEGERRFFLSPELLDLIIHLVGAMREEAGCWEMHGRNSVGIVFVESSRAGGRKFSLNKRNEILNELTAGLSWLVSEHPSNNLSWIYDQQFTKVDVANKASLNGSDTSYDAYFLDPAMGQVSFGIHTYADSLGDVPKYREDMRIHHRSEHAFVIFVTPFGSSWHAYSSGKNFILLSEHDDDWGGWGQDELNIITAHETCHKYGATDEYTGSGTPCSSCGGQHGCDKIPNGNCGSCAAPKIGCVMNENHQVVCAYTRGQIGWSDIFVELWTEDEWWAGTDDDVWLDIGDRSFVLDTAGHDDRERGNREGYALWAGGNLSRDQIKRILIRKSSDGFSGGWKLKKVKIYHAGNVICEESPHQWLEDNRRWWAGCQFNPDIVNSLKIKVTTADVSWAGTDDDVTLKLAGYSWNLDNSGDDFERGDTNTFVLDPRTGLYKSAIHTITIQKSSDGAFGGWKLKGVELIVNGTTLYNNQSINKWLEDDDRIWTDSI